MSKYKNAHTNPYSSTWSENLTNVCVMFLAGDRLLAASLSCCLIMQSLTGLFCHWIKCIIYLHFTRQEAKRIDYHFPLCVCVCGTGGRWVLVPRLMVWTGSVSGWRSFCVPVWRPRLLIEACFCSQTKLQQHDDTFISLLLNTSQEQGNKSNTQHSAMCGKPPISHSLSHCL